MSTLRITDTMSKIQALDRQKELTLPAQTLVALWVREILEGSAQTYRLSVARLQLSANYATVEQ